MVDRTQADCAELAPLKSEQLVFIADMGATLNLETNNGRSQPGPRAGGVFIVAHC